MYNKAEIGTTAKNLVIIEVTHNFFLLLTASTVGLSRFLNCANGTKSRNQSEPTNAIKQFAMGTK